MSLQWWAHGKHGRKTSTIPTPTAAEHGRASSIYRSGSELRKALSKKIGDAVHSDAKDRASFIVNCYHATPAHFPLIMYQHLHSICVSKVRLACSHARVTHERHAEHGTPSMRLPARHCSPDGLLVASMSRGLTVARANYRTATAPRAAGIFLSRSSSSSGSSSPRSTIFAARAAARPHAAHQRRRRSHRRVRARGRATRWARTQPVRTRRRHRRVRPLRRSRRQLHRRSTRRSASVGASRRYVARMQ